MMVTTPTLPCTTCGYVGTSACPRCGWINAEIRRNDRLGRSLAETRPMLDALPDWQARMDYRDAFGEDAAWTPAPDERVNANRVVHVGEGEREAIAA